MAGRLKNRANAAATNFVLVALARRLGVFFHHLAVFFHHGEALRAEEYRHKLPNSRLCVTASSVIVFLLCSMGIADDETAARREANRKKISQRTASERQRLEDNAREFQKLTPEHQQKLRDLQQTIERDPSLQAAFTEYENWANSLTPLQRSELRKAPDSKSRLELIREFQRQAGPDLLNPPGEPWLPSRTPDQFQVLTKILGKLRPPPVPAPSSEEFAALINALEEQLPAERREVLRKMDSFSRQVHVIDDSKARLANDPNDRRFLDPNDGLSQHLIDAFADGSPAEQFVKSQSGPAVRFAILQVLLRGLITELILSVDLYFPSDDEISRFEETLSPGEREVIARQPPDQWLTEVRLLCLEAKVPGIRDFRASSRNFEFMSGEWRRRFRDFDRGRSPFDRNRSTPPNRFEPERPAE